MGTRPWAVMMSHLPHFLYQRQVDFFCTGRSKRWNEHEAVPFTRADALNHCWRWITSGWRKAAQLPVAAQRDGDHLILIVLGRRNSLCHRGAVAPEVTGQVTLPIVPCTCRSAALPSTLSHKARAVGPATRGNLWQHTTQSCTHLRVWALVEQAAPVLVVNLPALPDEEFRHHRVLPCELPFQLGKAKVFRHEALPAVGDCSEVRVAPLHAVYFADRCTLLGLLCCLRYRLLQDALVWQDLCMRASAASRGCDLLHLCRGTGCTVLAQERT